MFTLNVKCDVQPAIAQLNAIKAGLGDRAIASALNKTANQAKNQIARGIGQEYNLPSSLIKDRLSVQRANRAGLRFTATLLGNPAGRAKRSMNVIHFVVSKGETRRARRAAQLAKAFGARATFDLRFQIRRTGSPQSIGGAFIGNKGRTVFRRVGAARLPIEAVQTIGVPQMFQAKRIQIPVQQWITANFPRIFESDLRYFLGTVAR